MREVRQRENVPPSRAGLSGLLGWLQTESRGGWQDGNLDTTFTSNRAAGTARELSSKTNNSCGHAGAFLQLGSFSKEALNSMNLPGVQYDDSGLTAVSTTCHLE